MLTFTPPVDAKPSAAATAAYRRHVQQQPSEPDLTILEAAWKCGSDFTTDLATYQRRLDANYSLTETIPRMQEELQEAKQALAAERKAGPRLLSEFSTIAELYDAIQKHVAETTPGFPPSANYLRAHDLQVEINHERLRATEILRQTSDQALNRRLSELLRDAADTETRCRSLKQLADIDTRIEKQAALVNDLCGEHGERAKAAYRQQRAKLAELHALRPQKAEAEKARPGNPRQAGRTPPTGRRDGGRAIDSR